MLSAIPRILVWVLIIHMIQVNKQTNQYGKNNKTHNSVTHEKSQYVTGRCEPE